MILYLELLGAGPVKKNTLYLALIIYGFGADIFGTPWRLDTCGGCKDDLGDISDQTQRRPGQVMFGSKII